jgi:hypothetical protein
VHVDEAGHQRVGREVDDAIAWPRRGRTGRGDSHNLVAGDDDGLVRRLLARMDVEHVAGAQQRASSGG